MSLEVLPRTRAEQIGAFSTKRPEKFGIYYARMALMDFLTVAVTAYLTGFMYHALALQPLEASERSIYVTTALFLSSTSLLISLASRQFATVQLQQQYKFLLSGVGSVALAFSLLLSAMFLLKLSADYSRATFSLQFVAVTIAVVAERAISHSRLRFLVKSGRIEFEARGPDRRFPRNAGTSSVGCNPSEFRHGRRISLPRRSRRRHGAA